MIRLIKHQDIVKIYEEIDGSREGLAPLVWAENTTMESLKEFLDCKIDSVNHKLYGIFDEDCFCGCIELRNKGGHDEVDYWLGVRYRGVGLMNKSLVDLMSLNVGRIFKAKVRHENLKSKNTLITAMNMKVESEDDEWIYLSTQ